ncbi:mucin-17-like [Argonauta hians]
MSSNKSSSAAAIAAANAAPPLDLPTAVSETNDSSVQSLADGRSENRRRKFKPLHAVRRFFKGNKKRSKSKDSDEINIVSVRAKSTSALHSQSVEDYEDDGGFHHSRRSLRKNKSRSEDSVLMDQHAAKPGFLRKLACSVEGIDKSLHMSNSEKLSTHGSQQSLTSLDEQMLSLANELMAGASKTKKDDQDSGIDLEAVGKTTFLNTDAAKFKISVRPKSRKGSRNHRRNFSSKISATLPSLNEEQCVGGQEFIVESRPTMAQTPASICDEIISRSPPTKFKSDWDLTAEIKNDLLSRDSPEAQVESLESVSTNIRKSPDLVDDVIHVIKTTTPPNVINSLEKETQFGDIKEPEFDRKEVNPQNNQMQKDLEEQDVTKDSMAESDNNKNKTEEYLSPEVGSNATKDENILEQSPTEKDKEIKEEHHTIKPSKDLFGISLISNTDLSSPERPVSPPSCSSPTEVKEVETEETRQVSATTDPMVSLSENTNNDESKFSETDNKKDVMVISSSNTTMSPNSDSPQKVLGQSPPMEANESLPKKIPTPKSKTSVKSKDFDERKPKDRSLLEMSASFKDYSMFNRTEPEGIEMAKKITSRRLPMKAVAACDNEPIYENISLFQRKENIPKVQKEILNVNRKIPSVTSETQLPGVSSDSPGLSSSSDSHDVTATSETLPPLPPRKCPPRKLPSPPEFITSPPPINTTLSKSVENIFKISSQTVTDKDKASSFTISKPARKLPPRPLSAEIIQQPVSSDSFLPSKSNTPLSNANMMRAMSVKEKSPTRTGESIVKKYVPKRSKSTIENLSTDLNTNADPGNKNTNGLAVFQNNTNRLSALFEAKTSTKTPKVVTFKEKPPVSVNKPVYPKSPAPCRQIKLPSKMSTYTATTTTTPASSSLTCIDAIKKLTSTSKSSTFKDPTPSCKTSSEQEAQEVSPKVKSLEKKYASLKENQASGETIPNRKTPSYLKKKELEIEIMPKNVVSKTTSATDTNNEKNEAISEMCKDCSSRKNKVLDIVKNFQKLQAT